METGNMGRAEYHRMVERIRKAAGSALSSGAEVLVVSKGDPELLDLGGARASHFPQGPDGGWSGYHPGSSLEALQHLEELRRRGAEYLLLPRSAYWWLGHYRDLAEYLERHCKRLATPGDECLIFQLGNGSGAPHRTGAAGCGENDQRRRLWEALVDSLLPTDAKVVVIGDSDLDHVHPRARVVQRLVLPVAEGSKGDQSQDPRIAELLGEEVDYLVIPRGRDGPTGNESIIVDRLRTMGRLVAYRRQLGWLIDVSPSSRDRGDGRAAHFGTEVSR